MNIERLIEYYKIQVEDATDEPRSYQWLAEIKGTGPGEKHGTIQSRDVW